MKRKSDEQLTYEQAYEKLEKLVGNLESGDLTLEKSLEIFEECIQLVIYCQKKLDEVERKIELLISKTTETGEQEVTTQDFSE
jgi:exodeoxyribonuclease VII small subunit